MHELPRLGVVHVATHAQFSEDAERSLLLTWDGRLGMNRLGEAIG
jgi:CHAT domain-containing protein